MNHMKPNALIHESSPYLLQHAHNPVAWEGWHPEVLEKARRENKLLLVSIGYAACHWCHVMEKECFEDEEVAAVMNRYFIPIKVDREERPDIDHIYMDALQLMTGGGGWPLNVAALPDGRPFWGATYVRKEEWIRALQQLAGLYEQSPDKVEGYARDLSEGLQSINLIPAGKGTELPSLETLDALVSQWSEYFDTFLGGYKRAPKFMMPGNLNFLLHYAHFRKQETLMDYLDTTLTKMADGGIYDALGGGFSRYSVDTKWHVPHFEKMLYDNAQLISLYARAYAVSRNERYRQVAEESIAFVKESLMAPGHGFYASLDADSLTTDGQLEEGAYYVWREAELQALLGADYPLFKDYYNINSYGHWEAGRYVLIRDAPEADIAGKHGLALSALQARIRDCRERLKKERDKRNPPRLDTKILASWNGWMLQGLVDAARYLERPEYLDLALKNAGFLCTRLLEDSGKAYHTNADGKEPISGYLEDYAALIQAFLGLYQQTFDPQWLQRCKTMADYCLEHFTDPGNGLFFFTSTDTPFLVRRTLETSDNVIPSSNSVMARNLFLLSKYFPQSPYGARSRQMLVSMREQLEKHPQGHANWLELLLCELRPFYEVAVTGPRALETVASILPEYLPQLVLAASTEPSELPLLTDRWDAEKTLCYVCTDGSCRLPVDSAKAALEQLKE